MRGRLRSKEDIVEEKKSKKIKPKKKKKNKNTKESDKTQTQNARPNVGDIYLVSNKQHY